MSSGAARKGPVAQLGLIIAFAVFLVDRVSKYVMLEHVDIIHRTPIEVTPFFNLVMVWNTGVSFGLFGEAGARWFLVGLAAVISIGLIIWLWQVADRFIAIALGLVIGGALGNMWDRARWGAVADFFDFHVAGWHFWAFNVADSGISIGVAMLLWDGFFRSPSSSGDDGA